MDPWVQVTQAPCALTASGRLECWASTTWPPSEGNRWPFLEVPDSQFPLDKVWARDSGVVWGITKLGSTHRVFCGTAFDGGSDAPWCDVPEPNDYRFVAIAHSCGLTSDGRLISWTDGEEPVTWYPEGPYRKLAMADAFVALDETNTLWFGGTYLSHMNHHWAPQPAHYTFGPEVEVEAIASWRILLGCILDTQGEVTCVDRQGPLAVQPFTNGPYQRIRGDREATCAQREDHVIECNDGQTHDFGPLRDFSVTGVRTFQTEELVIDLCALTEAGAIQCVGPRYPPDLLASLPTRDPLLER